MSRLAMIDVVDTRELSTPGEVVVEKNCLVEAPRRPRFDRWLRAVDETLKDISGCSLDDFARVPTRSGWQAWPVEPHDAALAVLRSDVWGQAFLGDLDLG